MFDAFGIRFGLIVGVMFSLSADVDGLALTQSVWPVMAAPEEARLFDIGNKMTFAGLPMRVQGFVSAVRPPQLADGFRQSLGQPLVEDRLGDKLILGRFQGEHYLTVQLEPAGAGTRGLIAVTHLSAAYESQGEIQAAIDQRQSRLPPGSRIISQINSEDGGKLAEHFVTVSSQGLDQNLEYVKVLMREDGFALQREADAARSDTSSDPSQIADGKVLFFKGPGKEAMAVVFRKDKGDTTIVLNTVTLLARSK